MPPVNRTTLNQSFLYRLLGILSPVDDGFSAMFAKFAQLFFDLVVILFIVRADVVPCLALGARPGAKLTFSSRHKKIC